MKINFVALVGVLMGLNNGLYAQQPVVITAQSVNGRLNATQFPGSPEIMVQVSNAFISCSYRCSVEVPAGSYTATVGLNLPLSNLQSPDLILDAGATINFSPTGPSWWLNTYETQASPAAANLVVEGSGTVNGNGNAAGAIRLLPTNNVEIKGIRIASFTNGDAIQINGTEHVNIHNTQLTDGASGIHIQGINCLQSSPFTCSAGAPPVNCAGGVCGYSGNMIHVNQNDFSFFTAAAFFEDGGSGYATYEHLSDTFTNNEVNGGNVGLESTYSRSLVVSGNYFEAQNVYFLLLRGSTQRYITGAVISGNYFTNTLAFTIEAEYTRDSLVQGNSENGGKSVCFLNFISTTRLLYQSNHVEGTNAACSNGAGNVVFTKAAAPVVAVLNSSQNGSYQVAGGVPAPNTGRHAIERAVTPIHVRSRQRLSEIAAQYHKTVRSSRDHAWAS